MAGEEGLQRWIGWSAERSIAERSIAESVDRVGHDLELAGKN